MIRQFELVERVKSYDPGADEDLLNRAYVFSMKAHGSQSRASGDPYFSHPLGVAEILTGKSRPDLVVSGINDGVNVGSSTVISGTVGNVVAAITQLDKPIAGIAIIAIPVLIEPGVALLRQTRQLRRGQGLRGMHRRKIQQRHRRDIRAELQTLAAAL